MKGWLVLEEVVEVVLEVVEVDFALVVEDLWRCELKSITYLLVLFFDDLALLLVLRLVGREVDDNVLVA